MINPYYFADKAIHIGLNITLDSRHCNHANSILTNKPKYSEIQNKICW